MFDEADLKYELTHLRRKTRGVQDALVIEANRILKDDLFADKKILQNLEQYKRSFEALDEESLESENIFTGDEIKRIAVLYRLKFLEGRLYKPEIPYEGELRISHLNGKFHKEVKEFKILAPYESFVEATQGKHALLFVKTNYENYYLVHKWGAPLKKSRKLAVFPLRNFEILVATVAIITLILAISLPTRLITLDRTAEYWSGYRAAAFFHLLIFNFGVTVYFTFTFAKNLSSTVWNRYRDF